jgi:hypothetical protein
MPAGYYLARQSINKRTPTNFLRERMAGRWLATCQRSARLGPGCYRLYRQIAPEFGFTAIKGQLKFAPKPYTKRNTKLHKIFLLKWLNIICKRLTELVRQHINHAACSMECACC